MGKDLYNISRLAFHPEKILALADKKITAPIYSRIKPTNRCDHHCSFCAYIPDNECSVSETINMRDEIPRSKLLEILSDFKDMGVKGVIYSGGGEPLIYPHISEITRKTLDFGIDLSIITNGQKLSGEKAEILKEAEWVRVSISENDAKLFSETRKVPESWFYKVTDNIEKFSKIKKHGCELGINFVVHHDNFDRVYDSVRFFRDLGVNHVKFTPKGGPDFKEYHKSIKENVLSQIEKARTDFSTSDFTVYDTYENDFNLTGLNERTYSHCHFMQVVPVIGADSCVYFCHDKTYNTKGILGSLKDKSFKDLWFSEEAAKIFRDFDPRISCRHHCTYDARNILTGKIIEDLDNIGNYLPKSDKHKNFV